MTLRRLGTKLPALPVALTRVRTLEYFEGDRIVEAHSSTGDTFLQVWFDTDGGDLTRWLVIRVSPVTVSRFLAKRVSLRDLVLNPSDGFLYVVDRNDDDEVVQTSFVEPRALPEDEVPSSSSYHTPTLTPTCDRGATQTVLLDGEWDVPRLSHLDRRYRFAYAALAVLGKQPKRRKTDISGLVEHFRFEGGWPHVMTFNKIKNLLPPEYAPNFQTVQYASPGLMQYKVDPELAERVRSALRLHAVRSEQVKDAYDALHGALLALGRARKERAEPHVLGQMRRALRPPIDALMQLLPLDSEAIWQIGGKPEQVGQVLAGFYRQFQELYDLVSDDDATLI